MDVDTYIAHAISIHAPQWGATAELPYFIATVDISIHAPQWGATKKRERLPFKGYDFNPRTPVGCDSWPGYAPVAFVRFQSTHPSGVRPAAPAGARAGHHISIHAPQWGATPDMSALPEFDEFQSTHPSGVRLVEGGAGGHPPHISIHAPQWGATKCNTSFMTFMQFQSTHPSGARRITRANQTRTIGFQSTHPSGVRRTPRPRSNTRTS